MNNRELKQYLVNKYFRNNPTKRFPYAISFELLTACNFKCIHCYNAELKNTCINLETAKSILSQAKDMGCEIVTFTGGEVLLYPHFEELYTFAINLNLKVNVFSNGYYIDKFISLFNKHKPNLIEISIYGASNDTYKKVCLVNDGFDKVSSNISLLKENNIEFKLKTVIMQQNFDDFEHIKDFCKNNGTDFKVEINILNNKAFTNLHTDNILSNEQFEKFMQVLKSEKIDFWKKQKEFDKSNNLLFRCGAGKQSLFIASNGGVRMCNFAEFTEKNIKDFSLKEIWDSFKPYLELKEDENGKCFNCEYRKHCSICPVVTYMNNFNKTKLGVEPNFQNCRDAKFIYDCVNNE